MCRRNPSLLFLCLLFASNPSACFVQAAVFTKVKSTVLVGTTIPAKKLLGDTWRNVQNPHTFGYCTRSKATSSINRQSMSSHARALRLRVSRANRNPSIPFWSAHQVPPVQPILQGRPWSPPAASATTACNSKPCRIPSTANRRSDGFHAYIRYSSGGPWGSSSLGQLRRAWIWTSDQTQIKLLHPMAKSIGALSSCKQT